MLKKTKWHNLISSATTLSRNHEITNTSSITYYGKTSTRIINKIQKCKSNIRIIPRTKFKLKNLLNSTKHTILDTEKSGIYQITCSWYKVYIGQSKRRIHTRYQDHISHIKYNRPEKSNTANHILQNDHTIINLKLIKTVTQPHMLDAYESIFIHKTLGNILNTDKGPMPNPEL